MRIGIAGPIEIISLEKYLNNRTDGFPKGMGGTSVNNLIHGLLELGHSIVVYSLDPGVEKTNILYGRNLTIYIGKYRNAARLRMKDFFAYEANQIGDFIRKDPPDIVHAQWSYEYALGTLQNKVPHLITLRDVPIEILSKKKDLYRLIRLLIHIRVVNKGKHFTAVSPYLSEQKLMPRIDRIIGNSVLDQFIALNPKTLDYKKLKIISCLNGWGKIKNPVPALHAFAILRKKYGKKIEYHLYGANFEPGGIAEKWACDTGTRDGVFFHGWIPHIELMQLLPDHDILMHPALEESFGNTLIEGMAAGLPIVAGKEAGAVPWVLADEFCGMLVDVRSPQDIASTLDKLISDPNLYRSLSERGLENVRTRFSNRYISEQYIVLYQEILNKSRKQC